MRQCALSPLLPAWCSEAAGAPLGGVDYDADRCREPRALTARGLDPREVAHFRLYHFLGRRHRVVYEVSDEVPISGARLAYLLDDVPLAARLVTHFQGTVYTASYTDATRRTVKGSRGKNLRGEAELVSGSTAERVLYYFGLGVSDFGPWDLKGRALAELRWTPTPAGVRYHIRVVSTPANAAVDVVMRTGLFRRIVLGHLRALIDDATAATRKLQAGGREAVARSPAWTAEERAKLDALLALP